MLYGFNAIVVLFGIMNENRKDWVTIIRVL